MKPIYAILLVLLGTLQYLIWFGDGGLLSLQALKTNVRQAEQSQGKMRKQNYALMMQIEALKTDRSAIESLAREEHNMVQKDETYFQIIENERQ